MGRLAPLRLCGCWYGSKTPCPNGGGTLSVDTSGIADGAHRLTVRAIDAADNVADATQTINTDNTPPSSPSAAALRGDAPWRSTNQFDISWTNPPQSGGPVAAAKPIGGRCAYCLEIAR
jgi:hypothetical protein